MKTCKVTMHTVLVNVRRLITDPNKWTFGTLARSASGNSILPCDSKAETFCALGAMRKVSGISVTNDIYNYIFETVGVRIHQTNDLGGHDAVLQAMDRAIDRLGEDIFK